ncbi:MAG: Lrp/AsnC ligand binding domain-containing protein, partial [Hyphomicrobium sp.]|nr:Lrp/AsnC ligand binding domain-containing protein [Hyphomicrobium sp.]
DLEFTHPGGESFAAIARRVLPILDDVRRRNEGRTSLVVAHGIVIRVALLSLLSDRDPADETTPPLGARLIDCDGVDAETLAERIALTAAPTLRRVRALEEAGVISRYVALVDPERIGLGVRVKVDVRLAAQTRDAIDGFSASVSAMPEVIECMILFGEWDFQVTVVARDVEDYQRFVLDRLAKLPGIGAYRSTLIMRVVKHTTVLPV